MKLKLVLAALIIAPLALTACSKKEEASKAQAEASAPAVADDATTAEQQAAIDALDKPVLDEKNQDVPAEVANAPADEATADAETAAQEQTAH